MKKAFTGMMFLLALLPALTACGSYDYSASVSEEIGDLFTAETEEFSVALSCVSREYPYASDGVAAERSDLIEIVLKSNLDGAEDFSVFVEGDSALGGEMSFRNMRGDYFYSQGVKSFPSQSVTLRVEWGEEKRELVATSVKNGETLSAKGALDKAVEAEKEYVESLRENGVFRGEFRVRLLRRDKNYYYVGIVNCEGETLSLLLDGESGEVLARREARK